MDYSFYGGRRGVSFILVEHYENESEMEAAFKQGPAYTKVNFDEYVIIDTKDKNDSTNGKVYRRGYNYQGELGGAVYVGQIVGPSGLSPHLSLATVKEVKDKINSLPDGINNQNHRYENGQYDITNSLVPGKYVDIDSQEVKFNDSINWVSCSLRDPQGIETEAHIGFSIPYLIIDYVAFGEDPYKCKGKDLAKRIDQGNHPFYEKWSFSIPKGIKGDSSLNFRVVAADTKGIQEYPHLMEDSDGKTEPSISDDKKRYILVYDEYNYDKEGNPQPKTYYVGDFNNISKIQVDQNGTIRIAYTHQDDTVIEKKIKWIDNIKIDTGDDGESGSQKIQIKYNNEDQPVTIGQPLNYIRKMAIEPKHFHLLVLYSDPKKRQEIISSGQNATYLDRNDWHDLGCVRDYNGILVGLNYELDFFIDNSLSGIIKQLNEIYPKGLIGENLAGKIITVGTDNQNKMFFGFDYSTENGHYKGWYYLGNFGNVPGVIVGAIDDINTMQTAETLPIGSIWLVVEGAK